MSTLLPPCRLRCEYHKNPLGIDEQSPRLSWELQDSRLGARQTAYEIEVGGDASWNTGKVESDQSIQVPYAGTTLKSRDRCFWRVRVWDQTGEPGPWSEEAVWEMGLLQKSDWNAQWIGGPMVGGPYTTSPCPYVRTEFRVDKPVSRARLYITALGLYEASCNGQTIGDQVFAPGWTDTNHRVQVQTFDLGAQIKDGSNVLGAILGDGWYCGFVGMNPRQYYGDRPKLFAQIEIDYEDGTRETISSGPQWKVAYGPILESDLMMGESYDARLELDGWSAPGFDTREWGNAKLFEVPDIALVARMGPPVRRFEEIIAPEDPVDVGGGRWIYNLGQNIAGRVRLRVDGQRGTTVTVRHAERLDPNGKLYTENLRAARATDRYTMKGGGTEVYEPRFTFHGFQYVELSGYPGVPPRDAVAGVVLHSDIPETGNFECSEPLINQLQHNIQWGQKGNFLEVPTDCPQRDERLGWTGDAQVFIRTAAFNRDVASFFTKWMTDMADSEADNPGKFPMVAPLALTGGADGGPAWADAAVICPWTVYQCYGDTRLLERHFASLTRFVDWMEATSKDLIRCYYGYEWQGFGDWLNIDAPTPHDLIGTAFFAHSARLLSEIAKVLGRAEDAQRYCVLSDRVRKAFQDRFVSPDGVIVCQSQTAIVLSLHFGLLEERHRASAVDCLVQDIERRGMRLSTGFVGAPYLPFVLSDNGRLDIAYKLLKQTRWPSWLYAVTQGATTIWERWDGWTHDNGFQDPGMNSFNHYAYGSIGEWMVRVVAGLDLDGPGFQRFLIQPQPGGELTFAKASLHTPYGLAAVGWTLDGSAFKLNAVIPPNSSARVVVPGEGVEGSEGSAEQEDGSFRVGAGSYTLRSVIRQ